MKLLFPLYVAAFCSFIATPLVILFARRFGLTDNAAIRPHPAHTHRGIIPRAGGLAIALAVIFAYCFFLPLEKRDIAIFISLAILVIVGILDDKRDISPYIRLGTNALAAVIIIASGIGIPFITNPITGGILRLDTWRITFDFLGSHSIVVWSDIFAFLWLMWTMNIIGWSAGVEGQMPGFVGISAFILALLAFRFSFQDPIQQHVTTLAFIVSGSFIGFLPWNFYPQKIMPGYSGKTIAGFFLGVLGILSYGKFGTALLVLGIPTIDAIYTLIRRIGKGHSPVWADRGHLHHRLLDLGWGKRRIALFYWLVSGILGAVALTVTSQEKIFILLLIAVGIGGFFIWVNLFTQFSKPQDPDNG